MFGAREFLPCVPVSCGFYNDDVLPTPETATHDPGSDRHYCVTGISNTDVLRDDLRGLKRRMLSNSRNRKAKRQNG